MRISCCSGPSLLEYSPFFPSSVSWALQGWRRQHHRTRAELYILLTRRADIPGLNDVVMQHTVITWEIALSFGMTFLFLLMLEAWKYCKRAYFRRREAQGRGKAGVLDPFAMFATAGGDAIEV